MVDVELKAVLLETEKMKHLLKGHLGHRLAIHSHDPISTPETCLLIQGIRFDVADKSAQTTIIRARERETKAPRLTLHSELVQVSWWRVWGQRSRREGGGLDLGESVSSLHLTLGEHGVCEWYSPSSIHKTTQRLIFFSYPSAPQGPGTPSLPSGAQDFA